MTDTRTPNKWIPSPAVRAWLYGIVVAAGAVAVLYGIVTQEQVSVWLHLIEAALLIGTGGLALANTPKAPPGQ